MTIARYRAAERTGVTFDAEHTVLVGDTPRDVEAGRRTGVRVVAVASGRSTASDLRAAGAEDVLPDLTDVSSLVRMLVPGEGR
ncbi:HAD family hydrolase [Saccharothrix deserti]|uniref:HAD family hydrolase n=1 Tax=Saccharothrix deserti TaxID=2593674 RepID=UPI00131D7E4A